VEARDDAMDERRLRDLLWEATADCHDEEEQFWSIFYTLAEGGVSFPLQAEPAQLCPSLATVL
jgi:hypothetical protein